MKTSVSLGPTTFGIEAFNEFGTAEAVGTIAREAERLGFDAVYVTEHPIPRPDHPGGGHHAPDPFVTLAAAAGATTTLGLQTHLLVLPYHNPFLLAKSIATLDLLCGGRLVIGVGAGYVHEEFAALGVDFGERNELTDEAILAMKAVWTGAPVRMTGRHFVADGNTALPRPVQRPHPPLWVGGNSRRAIRRAVDMAEGWAPFPNPPGGERKGRTASLFSLEDLAARIAYMREYARSVGREAPLSVALTPRLRASAMGTEQAGAEIAANAARLAAAGVTHLMADLRGDTLSEFLVAMREYAEGVLPATRQL